MMGIVMATDPYPDLDAIMIETFNENSIATLLSQLPVNAILSDVRLSHNRSLLHLAAKYDNVGIARYLLDNGCDIDAPDEYGSTPLMYALSQYFSTWNVVELLIISGARIDVRDAKGKGPLTFAKRYSSARECDALFACLKRAPGYSIESFHAILLQDAISLVDIVKIGDVDMTRLAIDRGADVNQLEANQENALLTAVSLGYSSQVQLLLERGADATVCDRRGYSPLQVAAKREDAEAYRCIELLLKHGAPVNQTCRNERSTALHTAASLNFVDNVRLLLENGASVNAAKFFDDSTPLMEAIWAGQQPAEKKQRTVQMLLKYGADVALVARRIERIAMGQFARDAVPPLLQHFAKLELIGQKMLNEKHVKVILEEHDLKAYRDKCAEEIEKMRNAPIFQNVRVINVLMDGMASRVGYTRIKKVVELFKTDFVKTAFPIYADILEKRFDDALKLRILQDKAVDVLGVQLSIFELPRHVLEKIVSYLGADELRGLS